MSQERTHTCPTRLCSRCRSRSTPVIARNGATDYSHPPAKQKPRVPRARDGVACASLFTLGDDEADVGSSLSDFTVIGSRRATPRNSKARGNVVEDLSSCDSSDGSFVL